MPIADPLPEAVAQRWRALADPNEEVVLTVASDVTASGTFGQRWLVITNRRVVVLPDSPDHTRTARRPAAPTGR